MALSEIKSFFNVCVYDIGDGAGTLINVKIVNGIKLVHLYSQHATGIHGQ